MSDSQINDWRNCYLNIFNSLLLEYRIFSCLTSKVYLSGQSPLTNVIGEFIGLD